MEETVLCKQTKNDNSLPPARKYRTAFDVKIKISLTVFSTAFCKQQFNNVSFSSDTLLWNVKLLKKK